jgi:hypothetical protein
VWRGGRVLLGVHLHRRVRHNVVREVREQGRVLEQASGQKGTRCPVTSSGEFVPP